jgi:hypothetical protein
MEPVFMLLGQSAATIAALAILAGSTPGAVQDVPYNELRPILERDGQVLEVPEEHRSA